MNFWMNKKQVIISFVLIVLIVFSFVFFSRKVVIKDISCKSQYSYCGDYLDRKISEIERCDYWTTKKKLKELLNSEGLVQKYNILYRPLNSILVNIVMRKGVAAVKIGPMYYVFDKNGFILSEVKNTDLVYFFVDGVRYGVGDTINDELLFYSKLVIGTNKMFPMEKAFVDENGYLEIKLRNGPLVLFPKEGDRDILLGSLRLIINQLNKDSQNLRIEKDMNTIILDLRYKNPVIKR